MSQAVDGARRLLAALAGAAPPPGPALDLPSLQARLVEHPADTDARAPLLSLVQARTLPTRVAAAMAEDVVDVILRDGSVMPRAAAERALALKEEERVYPPLRGPLLLARRRAFDPVAARVAFDDATVAVGLAPSPNAGDELAFLRAFLTASAPLAPAALEVLEGIAGPIHDGATLARALDRPAGEQAADQVMVDVVRVTRDALPKQARGLKRMPAPRLLAGHVVDDGDTVRVLWAESRTLGRQRGLGEGVGRAFATLAGVVEVAAGLGLALQAAPVRRAVGASSSQAASLWRETVAASLLMARLEAAVAVAFVDAEVDPEAPSSERLAIRRDVVQQRARGAVGVAASDLADELLLPPWPDGVVDRDAAAAAARRACARARGGADAIVLRDVGDEGLLLRPQRLLAVREALTGAAAPTPEAAATGWQTLLGEVA